MQQYNWADDTYISKFHSLAFTSFLKIMVRQTFWIEQKSSKQNSEKLGFISKLISWRDLREGLTGFVHPAQPIHAPRWKFCETFFWFCLMTSDSSEIDSLSMFRTVFWFHSSKRLSKATELCKRKPGVQITTNWNQQFIHLYWQSSHTKLEKNQPKIVMKTELPQVHLLRTSLLYSWLLQLSIIKYKPDEHICVSTILGI